MHLVFKAALQMSGLLYLLDTNVMAIIQVNLCRLVDEGDWENQYVDHVIAPFTGWLLRE